VREGALTAGRKPVPLATDASARGPAGSRCGQLSALRKQALCDLVGDLDVVLA